MTRKTPTKFEAHLQTTLIDHLRSQGHAVRQLERAVEDRPDIALVVDGLNFACECVQVTPDRIYKHWRARHKQLEKSAAGVIKIVWPWEPHIWIRDAIASKNRQANAYKRNISADRVCLLIHETTLPPERSITRELDLDDDLTKLLAGIGVSTNKHNFDEIYFWSCKNGIRRIFPHHIALPRRINIEMKNPDTYPTRSTFIGGAQFMTTAIGAPSRTYDYGEIDAQLIIVPPQDPNFKKLKPDIGTTKYRFKIEAFDTSARIHFEPVKEKE